MALTDDEQSLHDHAASALPDWFRSDERAMEDLGLAAKVMGAALVQTKHWLGTQAYITTATGPAAGEPDWLAEHARDRDTRRQGGEGDQGLRDRIRRVPYSITRPDLLAAVGGILAADGVAGSAAMVELPRDAIYLGSVTQLTGIGGAFSGPGAGGAMTFSPSTRFSYHPFGPVPARSGRVRSHRLVITGSATPAQNGAFAITGMAGDAVTYVNAAGAAGVEAGTGWALERLDRDGHVIEGHAQAYLDRGDRLGRGRGGELVIILPFGTPDTTRKSVSEMLRQRKAAGIILRVERRETAP